ncbi:MAG: 2-oxo acid dehydrogenase subunit E2 [Thermoplasmata archaeon]|nr:MAG: 2-oxo acid dehydrogenase subunit E2 [Thermoplasmata archaeon]
MNYHDTFLLRSSFFLMDDRIGEYASKKFSKDRKNISLILEQGKRKHVIHALIEVDVTEGRKMIRAIKEKTGKKISFTGWIVKCIAQTISEYPEFNTFRHGRNKMVTFRDVDVALPVERMIDGTPQPMVHIIRKANEKSVDEITEEIRAVQKNPFPVMHRFSAHHSHDLSDLPSGPSCG